MISCDHNGVLTLLLIFVFDLTSFYKGAGISGQLFMSLTEVKLKGRYKIDLTPVGMDTIITLQEDLRPIPGT